MSRFGLDYEETFALSQFGQSLLLYIYTHLAPLDSAIRCMCTNLYTFPELANIHGHIMGTWTVRFM